MRISELSRASGVPVATVKYYLRQGLLPAGQPTSATQALYDDTHLHRLRLVRALVEVAALSLAEVAAVVSCLDDPPTSWHEVLGAAHSALPPHLEPLPPDDLAGSRAWQLVQALGWKVDSPSPALSLLDRALSGAEAAGMSLPEDVLSVYADAARTVAEVDVAGVPTSSPAQAARHVVLGTLVYEPVLLALRRLAQVDASARRFAGQAGKRPRKDRPTSPEHNLRGRGGPDEAARRPDRA